MKNRRSILTLVLWILATLATIAQDVTIMVTPVQQVLPPQVLMYIDNPGKFFGVQLTNNTDREQQIYVGMQIEQKIPSVGLALSTPPKRQPAKPIVLVPRATLHLTSLEIKNLFKHIPSNEISAPAGLFDDYQNGSFALLPEGEYEAHLTAYRWSNPQLSTPLVVSNPSVGTAHFTVCYKAQAPEFIVPNPKLAGAELPLIDPLLAMFRWSEPTLTCNPAAQSYRYDFRVVEQLPGQQPDDAMDHNPVVYLSKSNVSPMVIVPALYMQRDFKPGKTYLAQVTARPVSTGTLNYVMLENDGKSTYCKFKIKSVEDIFGGSSAEIDTGGKDDGKGKDDGSESKQKGDGEDDGEDDGESEGEDDSKDDGSSDGSGIGNVNIGIDIPELVIDPSISIGDEIDLGDIADDLFLIFGEAKGDAVITEQAPYRFRNPKIDKPLFVNEAIHRYYEQNDIALEWTRAWYLGGEGRNPEQIKFDYNVQLFNGGDVVGTEQALLTVPILEKKTSEETLTIKWDDIKNKVKVGDELYVRIVPIPDSHEEEIEWEGKDNVLGLTLCKPLAQSLFECTPTVTISNLHPTTKTAAQLKGKTVMMGEFEMVIEEIAAAVNKAGAWTGKGKMHWMPMGVDTWVKVKFDSIRINTDNVVYSGEARTYAKDTKTEQYAEGTKTLFSDFGLNNYVGGGASYQYSETTVLDDEDPNNAISVNVDVHGYFNAFHNMTSSAKAAANKLGQARMDEFYCPARLPESLGTTALDMQIHSMTFAPTYAMMDIVGELQIGEGPKSSVLMFGAPRLCLSPIDLIPEAGTIALLADYNGIRDPKTGYSCRFRAPKNLKEPSDGCFIAWKNYKFGRLGIDVDMKIPNLLKVENDKATKKKPILNIKTTIDSWDDWVASATLDPFEVEQLPNWTFVAKDIVIDHSRNLNHANMPQFPQGYDKSLAGMDGQNPEYWEGLFIKDIGVKLPKDISPGATRTTIDFQDMFIDQSGLTMKGGVSNVLKGKTSKLGGWSFNLKEIGISFIQSDFNNCYFNGNVGLPLLTTDDGKKAFLDYNCEIRRRIAAGGKNDGTALLFTVQAADDQDLNLDLFLAKVKLSKATTYLAAETVFGAEAAADNHTYVEFCMGGVIELGAKDQIEKFGKNKLSVDINIPDVHFTGFRMANCADDKWTSAYESISTLQKNRRAVKLNPDASYAYYKGDEKHQGDFYFNVGQWSLASLEKQLGPFKFTLDTYKMDINIKGTAGDAYVDVGLILGGSVSLVDDFAITAGAEVKVTAAIRNIHDIDNISVKFGDALLTSCSVDCKVAGMGFSGSLKTGSEGKWGKGFKADITVSLPGDLFELKASGAYFKHSQGYRWGYLVIDAETSVGVPVPPVQFNGFSGGFYFNCQSRASDPNDVTPKKGVIGAMLGVKISSMGAEAAFSGNFKMTIFYDTSRGCFSQFLFTGDMEAVAGLIQAHATLLYENTTTDQFFQLNITTDPKANPIEKAKAVNSEAVSPATPSDVQKDFGELEKEENKTTKGNHSGQDMNTSGAGAQTAGLGKLDFTLDFKVTMKEDGKKLARQKWHLYLGEPDDKKRIKMTLIDIDAKIVKVKIGANMYLCVGNELPGDGALPPIPDKIARYLDGSSHGSGMQSDNISQANASRAAAANNFGGGIAGGVMLGAQVYGLLDVNLGIIKGGVDMLAGFDLSLRKLSNTAFCVNIDRRPGYHGWYAEGQLYAYMGAGMSVHVNLGFIKTDIPLFRAELGGVLQMGGPSPTYFIGKLRTKVSLLGGLVKFNKKFEFECGQVCQVFRGDPLSNFVLFDKCTVGDTLKSIGWAEKNRIDPVVTEAPRIYANASLGDHFRVLDENELEKIMRDYNATDAQREEMMMQAERTFKFEENLSGSAILYKMDGKTTDVSKAQRAWYLDYTVTQGEFLQLPTWRFKDRLEPNSYYILEVRGKAYELNNGKWDDPITMDSTTCKREPKPWTQKARYYFATNGGDSIGELADLEKYVALAYPSYGNKLSDDVKDDDVEHYRPVYYKDATAPTIALKRQIQLEAFRKGRLQWRVVSPSGVQLYASDASWASWVSGTLNLEPSTRLKGIEEGGNYILSLDYLIPGSEKTSVDTVNIGRQHIHVLPKSEDWRTGTVIDGKRQNLDYEKPYVGSRLLRVRLQSPGLNVSDYDIAVGKYQFQNNYYFNADPMHYFSYLTNWAFVGGRKVASNFFQGLYVTTTQSAMFKVPGGRLYEGEFDSNANKILKEAGELEKYFFADSVLTIQRYGEYPLPVVEGFNSDVFGMADTLTMPHNPALTNKDWAKYHRDRIKGLYEATERFQSELSMTYGRFVNRAYDLAKQMGYKFVSSIWIEKELLKDYVGTFIEYGPYKVPYYQMALVTSPESMGYNDGKGRSLTSILSNLGKRGNKESQICLMMNLDGHPNSYWVYSDLIKGEKEEYVPDNFSAIKRFRADTSLRFIQSIDYRNYRVNAFNYTDGTYTVYGEPFRDTDNLLNGIAAVEYTVTDPYGNSPSTQVTYTQGQGREQKDVSRGKTVGGGDFYTSSTESQKENLESMKALMPGLAAADAKVSAALDKVKKWYKDAKRNYDTAMGRLVECYNNGVDTENYLGDGSVAATIKDDIGKIVDNEKRTSAENINPTIDQVATDVKTLQTLYSSIAKGMSSNRAIVIDANAELERGMGLRDVIMEHYEEMQKLYNELLDLNDEYAHAMDMLSDPSNLKKAKDIYTLAKNLDYNLGYWMNLKTGKIPTNAKKLDGLVTDVKDLMAKLNTMDNKSYITEYEKKKTVKSEFDTKIETLKTTLTLLNGQIDKANANRNTMAGYLADIKKVAPAGSDLVVAVSGYKDNSDKLYKEASSYFVRSYISDYEVTQYENEANERMDYLKIQAEAETIFDELKAVDKYCNDLLLKAEEYQLSWRNELDLSTNPEFAKIEPALSSCFVYVTGDPSDSKNFRNLTSSTSVYKTYRGLADKYVNLSKGLTARNDSVAAIYNRIKLKMDVAKQIYDRYCNVQKEHSYINEATNLYKSVKNAIGDTEDAYKQTREAMESIVEKNQLILLLELYPTPESINKAAREVYAVLKDIEAQNERVQSLEKKVDSESSDAMSLFDDAGYYCTVMGPWLGEITEEYAKELRGEELTEEIVKRIYDDVSFVVNHGRPNESPRVTNRAEFYYKYFLPAYNEALEKTQFMRGQAPSFAALDAEYEDARTKKDRVVIMAPHCLPDYLRILDVWESIFTTRFRANLSANGVEIANMVKPAYDGTFAIFLKREDKIIATHSNPSIFSDASQKASKAEDLMAYTYTNLSKMEEAWRIFDAESKDAASKLKVITDFISSFDKNAKEYIDIVSICKNGLAKNIADYRKFAQLLKQYGAESDLLAYADEYKENVSIVSKMVEVYDKFTFLVEHMDQLASEVRKFNTSLSKQTESFRRNLNSASIELEALYKKAQNDRITDATVTEMGGACREVDWSLIACYDYLLGANDGTQKTLWDSDAPYQRFRTSVSNLKSKQSQYTQAYNELKNICSQFDEYRKLIDENLEEYLKIELFQKDIDMWTNRCKECKDMMAQMEQMLQESEMNMNSWKKAYDKANGYATKFTTAKPINNYAIRLYRLNDNLTSAIEKAKTVESKLTKQSSGFTSTLSEKVDELVKAFDELCEDVAGGFASLTDDCDVVIYEGEQGFEERYSTSVPAMPDEIIYPAMVAARNTVKTSTSDADYTSLKSTYEKLKTEYETLKEGFPTEVQVLAYPSAGIQKWQQVEKAFTDLDNSYMEASRYANQKEYLTKSYGDCLNKLRQLVMSEGGRLVGKLSGYEAVYAQALDVERQVKAFSQEWNKKNAVLNALEADTKADGAHEKLAALIDFYNTYTIGNLHVALQQLDKPYQATKHELLDLYDFLGKYDAETALDDYYDDQMTMAKKVTEVINMGTSLKENMTDFRDRCIKLINQMQGELEKDI